MHADSGKFLLKKFEEVEKEDPPAYLIKFSAKNLPKMDGLFGKSDPFLLIHSSVFLFSLFIMFFFYLFYFIFYFILCDENEIK